MMERREISDDKFELMRKAREETPQEFPLPPLPPPPLPPPKGFAQTTLAAFVPFSRKANPRTSFEYFINSRDVPVRRLRWFQVA